MKILLCPDSFKGTLSAAEAAAAMAHGAASACPDAEVRVLPVGDGGEGTVASLVSALPDVEVIRCATADALRRPITAQYAIAGGKTALIESAAASGLTLINPEDRDIMVADTFGTGLLISDAISRGIRDFIVCMGGTATCDGGKGALEAMEKSVGNPSAFTLNFTLLCDVENPFCGPCGSAAVFGPQKGATPAMIPELDSRLRCLAREYSRRSGIDVSGMKHAGAAGGLAGMLMAVFRAKPVSGIAKVLELLDFEAKAADADIIITGEGKADVTTLSGKAPMGILRIAAKHGKPVALVCGSIADREALLEAGFSFVAQATPDEPDPTVSYADYLSRAVADVLKR